MGETKENRGFLRKVVQFVANPTMDWNDLQSRPGDARELDRSELRAMVERKRRNDFVRKREFETLRRVRREGLSAEQLAALGPSSRLEDGESRLHSVDSLSARAQGVVKAKIDHIEREMVGDTAGFRGQRSASFFEAPTEPGVLARRGPGSLPGRLSSVPADTGGDPSSVQQLPLSDVELAQVPLLSDPASGHSGLAASGTALQEAALGSDVPFPVGAGELGVDLGAVEIAHDPDLDEAVIAFANADFALCERSLQQLTGPGGPRADHAETWQAMFDLYRATGQQLPFESLALDFAHRFGWSAPQWFSIPRMVADAKAEQAASLRPKAIQAGDVGWVSPPQLDPDSVARLRSQTLQLPLPWVLDWSGVRRVDTEAATHLSTLFRLWAGQDLQMRWIGSERLFAALAEAAPTGVRDADPAFWLARLDALRLVNRADQFDETAIDYCVTYEVSPPSWEPARCSVLLTEPGQPTVAPQLSVLSEVSTSFQDSGIGDAVQVAHVDLSGQLVGDLTDTLNRINASLGSSPVIVVNCANLIRVDFIAAGDLLNWVLSRHHEGRQIQFVDTHRLVALFFGAMGITEHAKVRVRRQ